MMGHEDLILRIYQNDRQIDSWEEHILETSEWMVILYLSWTRAIGPLYGISYTLYFWYDYTVSAM